MKSMKRIASLTGLFLALSAPAFAQVAPVPALMNFQARLAKSDGTPLPDGAYTVTLSLYDALAAGNQVWTEIETVNAVNGMFAATLGATTPLTNSVFNNPVWLEIQVGMDAPLAPRQQLVTVAHAFKADVALSVPDASITDANIVSVDWSKITNAPTGMGGLTLPFTGSAAATTALFDITNSGAGSAIHGNGPIGIYGSSSGGYAGYFDNKVQVNAGFAVTGHSSPYPASIGNGVFIEGGSTTFGAVYAYDYKNNRVLNLVLNTPGGNVGIGTLTPQATLDVNGNVIERGSDFMLRGRGGGAGNNGGLGRALVDYGSGGLVLNFANDFGKVVIGSGITVLGGTTTNFVNIVGGSDVAEPYEVAPVGGVKPIPGMVVVMDEAHTGQMKVATQAYDSTVGGIISGANGINPGITLTQKGTVADGSMPVASVGRVWCWCDADANGPIKLGSLLTTSDTPGYAMRVTDFGRGNGATIGKAMSTLTSGKGLVLVLVSLK